MTDSQQLILNDLMNCQIASGEMVLQDRPWFVELRAQNSWQLLLSFHQVILLAVNHVILISEGAQFYPALIWKRLQVKKESLLHTKDISELVCVVVVVEESYVRKAVFVFLAPGSMEMTDYKMDM